jgi:hypothetical protein
MREMSRETDALLKRGRGGESLSPNDRSRLKRAVLAQAAAASVVATTSTAAAWTTVAAKVAVGVAIVGSVVGVGVGVGVVPTWTAKAPAQVAVTAPHATARRAEAREPAISIPPPPPPPGATAPAVVPEPVQPVVPIAKQHETVRPSPLEEETRGWNDADDALRRGDHDTTLRLLSELDARFPEGALAPERAAERVFALCAAGRTDEARQASNDFFRRQSVGPLAARVRAACINTP